MSMFNRTILTVTVLFGLFLCGPSQADISIQDKAQLIAEVINASVPKTDNDITITKATSLKNQVVIHLVADKPAFKQLTNERFQKLKPVFSKGFSAAVCEDPKQHTFIENGGKIKYSMKIATTPWLIDTEINTCEKTTKK